MRKLRNLNLRSQLVISAFLLILPMFFISYYGLFMSRSSNLAFYNIINEMYDIQTMTDRVENISYLLNDFVTSGDNDVYNHLTQELNSGYLHIENEIKTSSFYDPQKVGYLSNYYDAFDTIVTKTYNSYILGEPSSTLKEYIMLSKQYESFLENHINQWLIEIISDTLTQTQRIEDKLLRNEQLFFGVTLFVSIISITLAYIIANRITWPIHELSENISLVAQGNLNIKRIKQQNQSDVGKLINNSNFMLDKMIEFVKVDREKNELEKAKAVAEQSNLAKERLLQNVSHEVRTPLNAIIGHSSMIEKNPNISSEVKDSIAVIKKSSEHLLSMVNDLLDMSRFQKGGLFLNIQEIEIRLLIEETFNMICIQVEKKEIDIEISISPDVPTMVMIDPSRVKQVLVNLMMNAYKYTEKGKISIECSYDGSNINFHVLDTGVGIRKENYDKIFETFEQIGNDNHKSDGIGIGLTISRKIARQMGGDIVVNSEIGVGSDFLFSFPILNESSDQDIIAEKLSFERRCDYNSDGRSNMEELVRRMNKLYQSDTELVERFKFAASIGRIDKMKEQIDYINLKDRDLGKYLMMLFDDYEFEKIILLLNHCF